MDTYPAEDRCETGAVCADSAELTRKADIMPGEDVHAALLASCTSCPQGSSRDRATGSAVDVSTDDRTGAASRVQRN